jgi:hypothetical protein
VLSSNPLTASVDIQKTASQFKPLTEAKNSTDNEKKLGEFADDILNISALGQEKQRKEIQLQASQEIKDIANDVIRVSSSIGRARTLGNLTNSQATTLYNKIAALL